MRALVIVITLLLGLLPHASLRAGLYRTDGPNAGPEAGPDGSVEPFALDYFRTSVLPNVLKIALHDEANRNTPQRLEALQRLDALQQKERRGELTTEDRVNMSYYLLRLHNPQENQFATHAQKAFAVLFPTTREARDNFLAFSNMATVYQMLGETRSAVDMLQMALDVWPTQYPGFTPEQLQWFKRAEEAQLKLLRARLRERGQPADNVDDLFGVQFIGESGQYEAGTIAAAEKVKLPPDAEALVQQLILWMPGDTRLYWLLGELLNAQGKIEDAWNVMEDCVYSRRYNSPLLKEHRQIVMAARQAQQPSPPQSWLPSVRQLIIVGGVAGVIFVLLMYLQIRELRRRRQRATAYRSH
ncbi:MAG: hypothetical protein ACK4RK_14375 [Gemmataceae bacterium]